MDTRVPRHSAAMPAGWLALLMLLLSVAATRPVAGASEFDRTVPVRPGMRLDVRLFGGEIIVRAWDRDMVRVRATHFSTDTIDVRTEGPAVAVRARARSGTPHAIDFVIDVPDWMAVSLAGTYLDIRVDGTRADVSAETVRGDVRVTGGEGRLVLKSVEGEVVIERGRGRAEVRSVNNAVRVLGMEGDLVAETVSGSVKMQGVDGRSVVVSTMSGDISWDGPLAPSGRYQFATHDGDLDVTLPDTAAANVSVRSFDGEVHTTFPVKLPDGTSGRKRFGFALGNGGPVLELETFTGTISIRKQG